MNEDDHYKGYLIPKGATIMANNYAISRDQGIYPEPESFRPERFLDAAGTKLRPDLGSLSAPSELESQEGGILHPMRYASGFGHRTCPGRFLADALLSATSRTSWRRTRSRSRRRRRGGSCRRTSGCT